ncbi:uncharacterized protein LOC113400332 [Vanessa tameamea]|uniref:Uncharacterized protein LOC113400332 n=1 Tax=Vanessa tameamea TaxID=334116 RepID=A0A8B8IF04_VANTA|nr:uncharacterized protein LOC113400332 isoform X1 [Vanessa tameamea]
MFESDDYDQILSQIDFPDLGVKFPKNSQESQKQAECSDKGEIQQAVLKRNISAIFEKSISNKNNVSLPDTSANKKKETNNVSPKHTKRKIINSYFDHNSKRKFPGPAGLLSGNFEEKKDNDVCQMELLSQDIDFAQGYLHGNVFETPLWKRLLEDTASIKEINSIKAIKHQALAGNLHRKKAQFVIAIVESVDRSAIDPLITLRDKTGNIKCTLHRDAWTAFSAYIVSEYCAVVLSRPTVLTTGSAFKKHYLNITLSNIAVIYSSAQVNDNENLPDGWQKNCQEDYTIIKSENISNNDSITDDIDFMENLDDVFSNDLF